MTAAYLLSGKASEAGEEENTCEEAIFVAIADR